MNLTGLIFAVRTGVLSTNPLIFCFYFTFYIFIILAMCEDEVTEKLLKIEQNITTLFISWTKTIHYDYSINML